MNPETLRYETAGGVDVTCIAEPIEVDTSFEPLIDALDSRRGAVFTSTYEYPGRYTRWTMGFVDPPIEIVSRGRDLSIRALNARGAVLLNVVCAVLPKLADTGVLASYETSPDRCDVCISHSTQRFTEEQRSRQPTVFSVLREIIAHLHSAEDDHLGLYGAFGYDLAFQFDPITQHIPRPGDQRDLVLYIPDELLIVDHKREIAQRFRYDFQFQGHSTEFIPRGAGESVPFAVRDDVQPGCDHEPGEYERVVETAKGYFERGDLFEVVPSQTFFEATPVPPSELFRRLRRRNPAPYGALVNLGSSEYLIAASPEMYVRVEGRRVETCPIAGTIPRGQDVLDDADQILELLNSTKDESELTMCTDVDRNDKARICEPDSIRIIGRRQIETYSRLFHTVDHVEGKLRAEFDGLDAFLSHAWAVTVTGAPKLWAMRFIEEHEKSPRAWYGAAIGALQFNGNVNTGLTLRTIRVKDGVAYVRVGATLLIDSDPEAEEQETRTKASALLGAIRHGDESLPKDTPRSSTVGDGVRILLVDHEDSFVHTLASYLRRTGATVSTIRVPKGAQIDTAAVAEVNPDLIVISPGPGKPADFHMSETLAAALARNMPVFGVCLGLQGIVEHFGGKLGVLPYPAHGRASQIKVQGGWLFEGVPEHFTAGRYHSIYAEDVPSDLVVTAQTDEGVVMAVEHSTLPVAAVQFHPESLMSLKGDVGMKIIENVVRKFAKR